MPEKKPFEDLKAITARHSEVYEKLVSGDIDRKDGQEMNNAFGKIVNSFKVQVEAAKLKKKAELNF